MIIYLVYAALMAALLVSVSSVLSLTRSLLSRDHCCPRCHNSLSLKREPRNRFDRFIGRFVDSRRYKCLVCRWAGLLRRQPAPLIASPDLGVDDPLVSAR